MTMERDQQRQEILLSDQSHKQGRPQAAHRAVTMAMMTMTQAEVQKRRMATESQTRPRNIPRHRTITSGHQSHQILARHHILAQVPHILAQVQEQYQVDHHILAQAQE
jgi:hypothetical protein